MDQLLINGEVKRVSLGSAYRRMLGDGQLLSQRCGWRFVVVQRQGVDLKLELSFSTDDLNLLSSCQAKRQGWVRHQAQASTDADNHPEPLVIATTLNKTNLEIRVNRWQQKARSITQAKTIPL